MGATCGNDGIIPAREETESPMMVVKTSKPGDKALESRRLGPRAREERVG